MIEVSDAKKLGPKGSTATWMKYRFTIWQQSCSETKTVLSLSFLAKILLWLWAALYELNNPNIPIHDIWPSGRIVCPSNGSGKL